MDKLGQVIELQTVDSTNLYLEKLLSEVKLPEGSVVWSHEQTSGKGQGDNSWESEPGKNLTFSMVFYPEFLDPSFQFRLNKAISLGVLDFLSSTSGSQFSIKWPNDLYTGNRKIGGILIQNSICGTLFESCIAGIGINLNQLIFDSSIPNPASLKQITGSDYPLKKTLDIVIDLINDRYSLLQTGSVGLLDKEYREHLFGIDEWKDYTVDNLVIKGRIKDVDESGCLILEFLNSSLRVFNHGEIGFT
jgi:BirA family transcriptional regulator, biotin operon repressor / biotin---[acetyl-CoA-carboxylase] ligase